MLQMQYFTRYTSKLVRDIVPGIGSLMFFADFCTVCKPRTSVELTTLVCALNTLGPHIDRIHIMATMLSCA